MPIWKKIFHLPFRRKIDLVESILWLSLWKLLISLFPFRFFRSWLGTSQITQNTLSELDNHQLERVLLTKWAVRSASRHLPWRTTCLMQAVSGKLMLRRRGISSVLHVGVAKSSSSRLKAHAWLEYGGHILTGEREREAYRIIFSIE